MTSSFRSYIDLDDYIANGSDAVNAAQAEPVLLLGEHLVATASDALLYLPLSERPEGVRGRLVVTNFRLSFTEAGSQRDKTKPKKQRNLLLGQHDVCLTNVDTIHQLLSSSGKMKPLVPRSIVTGRIKGLQIRCKDFRLFTFSFKLSGAGQDQTVTNALLLHCYPCSARLLFAFHCQEPQLEPAAPERPSPADWQAELQRTGALGWRVSQVNELYQMCLSLPEALVVPKGLFDADFMSASGHFLERRPPVWCWGRPDGAAIVRSAYTHPDLRQSGQERLVLDAIRSSHPFLREPVVLDVGASCLSVEELQESYVRLRQLCSPESVQAFVETDGRFLSLLAGSRWLWAVSRCLAAALECVDVLTGSRTACVLNESSGRDTTAAVSCLAQLLLDPDCRTQEGFERLVQREWILLGHPFQERLGLVYDADAKKGPVFLLFLDCVHQLLEQFPDLFEFTETYLVSLWDSLFISLFDTFLFNCQKERTDAFLGRDRGRPLPARPVWQWQRQFDAAERELFTSPLYRCRAELAGAAAPARLRPVVGLPALRLWTLAFCRWVPSLHVLRGGRPAEEALQRRLLERLRRRRARLESFLDGVEVRRPPPPPPVDSAPLPGSLAPFAAGGAPSRVLCVTPSFVSTLLRNSIAAADEDDAGTLRRQLYDS